MPLPAVALATLDALIDSDDLPSLFSGQPCVLLDLRQAPGPRGPRHARRLHALRTLPAPVIGLGDPDHLSPLAEACDVVVPSAAEAEPLIDRIHATPIAAAIFVQLLRATEGLPLDTALFAESLAYSTLQAGPEYQAWLAANRAAAPAQPCETGPAVEIQREDTQLTLWLDRPSNRNAMSREMRDALIEALNLVRLDLSAEQVIIAGRGACFSTGGDLTEFGTAPDPATAHLVRSLALPGRALAACAERVTARLHGACVGSGIEFPAFAHRLEADDSAWFQLPELRFGLIPGAGGCVSIPRRIGRQRTAWMVLSGERVRARTARDWGLVDALV